MTFNRKEIPRPEYPRPQFVRSLWFNLNGEWEFAFDDADEGLRHEWYDGRKLPLRIIVPFAYQTLLSGINDKSVHEIVWYARSFDVPEELRPRDVLLNFGAVDYAATVWVNGREVGHNRGGHIPFQFDIAPYLKSGGNRLTVRVEDRQDPQQPRENSLTQVYRRALITIARREFGKPSGWNQCPQSGLKNCGWLLMRSGICWS